MRAPRPPTDQSPRDPQRGPLHAILRSHLAHFLAERERPERRCRASSFAKSYARRTCELRGPPMCLCLEDLGMSHEVRGDDENAQRMYREACMSDVATACSRMNP